MAKSKKQQDKGELSDKCANILVEFMNAHTLKDALQSLYWIFLVAFEVPTFDPRIEFQQRGRKCVRKAQQRLAKLFDELQEDMSLEKSDTVSNYNYDFFMLCQSATAPDARDNEEANKFACFEEEGRTFFEAVLAFCVHYYIQDENRKPIYICQYKKCGKYIIAERKTKQFCSKKHNVYHNRTIKGSMKLKMSKTNP
jgi:hypothetical protein